MPVRPLAGLRALAAAALAAAAAPGVPAPAEAPPRAPLTPQERDGKQVFLHGTSPSGGNVTARVGDEVLLPGSAVPCASCHGEDGRGRPEGGATPTPVRWSDLTKAYGHAHPDGRRHGPFDEASVARAITSGVDPAGNPLDRAMPRYGISRRDLESLVAYLKVLERDLDPGIHPDRLRIGTLLPDRGPAAAAGERMARVLRAAFDAANAGGGVNGRRLELVVEGFGPEDGAAAEAARRLVGRDVLALVSGFTPAADDDVAAVADAAGVPLVGPLAPSVRRWREHVFLVAAGLAEQARALAAAGPAPTSRSAAAVLFAPGLAAEAEAGERALKARGFDPVVRVEASSGATERIRAVAPAAVLVLAGDAALEALLAAAAGPGWTPRLLVPALLAARAAMNAPAALRDRVVVAFPSLPGDVRPEAARALAAIGVDVAGPHAIEALSAHAAAVLLEEGLARAGREVGRRRLVEALESVRGLETGVTRAVSYGPGRRVGTAGAHVLTVAQALDGPFPAETWVEVGGG